MNYPSHHFSDHEVEQLVGQRVVWTTEISHGVNAVIGGNAGRPIHLPADTHTHTRAYCYVFLLILVVNVEE